MKIQIGSIITSECNKKSPIIALNFPGIGAVSSIEDEEEKPFICIILDKKQLKKLRKEIDKELSL